MPPRVDQGLGGERRDGPAVGRCFARIEQRVFGARPPRARRIIGASRGAIGAERVPEHGAEFGQIVDERLGEMHSARALDLMGGVQALARRMPVPRSGGGLGCQASSRDPERLRFGVEATRRRALETL